MLDTASIVAIGLGLIPLGIALLSLLRSRGAATTEGLTREQVPDIGGRTDELRSQAQALSAYMRYGGQAISSVQAEERMFAKLESPAFMHDVRLLLSAEAAAGFDDSPHAAIPRQGRP